jgi:hypothetical protein
MSRSSSIGRRSAKERKNEKKKESRNHRTQDDKLSDHRGYQIHIDFRRTFFFSRGIQVGLGMFRIK